MLLVELRKPECSTEQDNKNACGDMKTDKRELFSFGLHQCLCSDGTYLIDEKERPTAMKGS